MHIIITRSHSAEPLAAFAIRGIWPVLAAAALAVFFALAVWHTALAVAERWVQSGHPLLAEVVRVRLDTNENERRALLREKIRLQNDAIADLQVRLWRVERSGAAIAENLSLPAGLFSAHRLPHDRRGRQHPAHFVPGRLRRGGLRGLRRLGEGGDRGFSGKRRGGPRR